MQETFLRDAGTLCVSTCSQITVPAHLRKPHKRFLLMILLNDSIGVNGIR